jgi:uncharacterized protein YndB with AHSA1/START domain
MKFEISFERVYPHPIEKVWSGLTDRSAVGEWLMETDFEPEAGRSFRMRCDRPDGGTDVFLCQVLALEPPTRMVWSWVLEGREAEGVTRVEFRLAEVQGGTRLTVVHSGDRDPATIEQFKGGWPVKLEQLAAALAPAGLP